MTTTIATTQLQPHSFQSSTTVSPTTSSFGLNHNKTLRSDSVRRSLSPPLLPTSIWTQIASYLPANTLQKLIGLNAAFFELAMDVKYRQVSFAYLDERMVKLVSRLRDPAVARRVRILHIYPGFLKEVHDKTRTRSTNPISHARKYASTLLHKISDIFSPHSSSQGNTSTYSPPPSPLTTPSSSRRGSHSHAPSQTTPASLNFTSSHTHTSNSGPNSNVTNTTDEPLSLANTDVLLRVLLDVLQSLDGVTDYYVTWPEHALKLSTEVRDDYGYYSGSRSHSPSAHHSGSRWKAIGRSSANQASCCQCHSTTTSSSASVHSHSHVNTHGAGSTNTPLNPTSAVPFITSLFSCRTLRKLSLDISLNNLRELVGGDGGEMRWGGVAEVGMLAELVNLEELDLCLQIPMGGTRRSRCCCEGAYPSEETSSNGWGIGGDLDAPTVASGRTNGGSSGFGIFGLGMGRSKTVNVAKDRRGSEPVLRSEDLERLYNSRMEMKKGGLRSASNLRDAMKIQELRKEKKVMPELKSGIDDLSFASLGGMMYAPSRSKKTRGASRSGSVASSSVSGSSTSGSPLWSSLMNYQWSTSATTTPLTPAHGISPSSPPMGYSPMSTTQSLLTPPTSQSSLSPAATHSHLSSLTTYSPLSPSAPLSRLSPPGISPLTTPLGLSPPHASSVRSSPIATHLLPVLSGKNIQKSLKTLGLQVQIQAADYSARSRRGGECTGCRNACNGGMRSGPALGYPNGYHNGFSASSSTSSISSTTTSPRAHLDSGLTSISSDLNLDGFSNCDDDSNTALTPLLLSLHLPALQALTLNIPIEAPDVQFGTAASLASFLVRHRNGLREVKLRGREGGMVSGSDTGDSGVGPTSWKTSLVGGSFLEEILEMGRGRGIVEVGGMEGLLDGMEGGGGGVEASAGGSAGVGGTENSSGGSSAAAGVDQGEGPFDVWMREVMKLLEEWSVDDAVDDGGYELKQDEVGSKGPEVATPTKMTPPNGIQMMRNSKLPLPCLTSLDISSALFPVTTALTVVETLTGRWRRGDGSARANGNSEEVSGGEVRGGEAGGVLWTEPEPLGRSKMSSEETVEGLNYLSHQSDQAVPGSSNLDRQVVVGDFNQDQVTVEDSNQPTTTCNTSSDGPFYEPSALRSLSLTGCYWTQDEVEKVLDCIAPLRDGGVLREGSNERLVEGSSQGSSEELRRELTERLRDKSKAVQKTGLKTLRISLNQLTPRVLKMMKSRLGNPEFVDAGLDGNLLSRRLREFAGGEKESRRKERRGKEAKEARGKGAKEARGKGVDDEAKGQGVDDEAKEKGVDDGAKEKGVGDKGKEKAVGNEAKGKGAGDEAKGKGVGDKGKEKAVGDEAKGKGVGDEAKGKGVGDKGKGKAVGNAARGKGVGNKAKKTGAVERCRVELIVKCGDSRSSIESSSETHDGERDRKGRRKRHHSKTRSSRSGGSSMMDKSTKDGSTSVVAAQKSWGSKKASKSTSTTSTTTSVSSVSTITPATVGASRSARSSLYAKSGSHGSVDGR